MKVIFPFFVLFSAVLLWSCKDPCKNVSCQNGGVCNDGTCDCPSGYTGANCETKILEPGVEHEGGIIFYVDNSGQHGFIAAKTDQAAAPVTWGCAGTSIPGAVNSTPGSGSGNTTAIVSACLTSGIAAKICYDLSYGGKDDWYLPSEQELTLLYSQKSKVGGFETNWYWSSTQLDATLAKEVNFADGLVGNGGKGNTDGRVRAIRSF